MKKLLLTAALLASTAIPAAARLQISIRMIGGGDVLLLRRTAVLRISRAAPTNLLIVDQTVNGAFVQLALTQSQFGAPDELQLPTSEH